MLHVTDEWLVPIQKINGAVRGHAHRGGAEVRVIRFHQVVFDRLAFEAGALFGDFHPEDALETNDIDIQKIALKLFGEMAAGKNASAGTWTRWPFPELLHLGVFSRGFQVAAEGRAEVAVVARGVGDDVVAPIIKDTSVGVGE